MAVPTSIAPWIAVSNGDRAVEFYKNAFGAVEVYRLEGDDGGVAVAQLTLDGAAFWVQEDTDATPESGAASPIRMIVTTEDPDALFARAVAAGATQVIGMSEEHGWRTGRVTDPFGLDWEFAKPVAE